MLELSEQAAQSMAAAYLGGTKLMRLADRHFGDGVSVDVLAAESGIARSTLYRRLDDVFDKLSTAGGVPAHWTAYRAGKRRR